MSKTSQAVIVLLIETVTIPARKGRFIEASLEHEFAAGDEVVFELEVNTLQSHGLSSMSLILIGNGNLSIPL